MFILFSEYKLFNRICKQQKRPGFNLDVFELPVDPIATFVAPG